MSSTDLHEGRIDPSRYTAIVFSGHEEYWSTEMRDWAQDAVVAAFLASLPRAAPRCGCCSHLTGRRNFSGGRRCGRIGCGPRHRRGLR
ncbi:N,N-dimethylformamidase beta subunit family domain-containing protein [Streptomyces clavifer]|uniref:N,N-dimethylformamidase beta subunit family domain-containing protein n=1 Tax=Streptomyces clavifer TaxID=68188 RepID=UPI0037A50EFF